MLLNSAPINAGPINGSYAANVVVQADSWQSGGFETPYAANAFRASSIDAPVRFGTPTTPTYLVVRPFTWSGTQFGVPYAMSVFEPGPEDATVQASSFGGSTFGVPTAKVDTVANPASWSGTQFGTPRLALVGQVTTVGPGTQFESPSLTIRQKAASWSGAGFGTPSVAVGHIASSFGGIRHGAHKATVEGTLLTKSFGGTRFGTPSAFDQLGALPAESWSETTFGTPAVFDIRRAAPISSGGFGRPTLRRNPTC